MEINSTTHIISDCKYNIVFCTKYRKKMLVGTIADRLKELFKTKISEMEAEILEINIREDHIILTIKCDPQYGIHKVVKHLKGYSSTTLREEFKNLKSKLPSLWTNSYYITTIGENASREDILKYVDSQKERGE